MKQPKIGNYEIPYCTSTGEMASYVGYLGRGLEMRPNDPIELTLAFDHFSRGRSSALAMFKSDDGRQWPMFLTCLHDVVPHLVGGKIRGRWAGVKRGTNYSIKLLEVLA